MATWERKLDMVWGLTKEVAYLCEYNGVERRQQIAFRIDGREGSFRVDRFCPILNYWVAIDGTQRFTGRLEASAFVANWIAAVVLQGTIDPQF